MATVALIAQYAADVISLPDGIGGTATRDRVVVRFYSFGSIPAARLVTGLLNVRPPETLTAAVLPKHPQARRKRSLLL